MEKKYTELVKPRITDTRKMIISRINATGEYKLVELAEFKEGERIRTMILRGGIKIDSLKNLRNVRDAINQVLDEEGFYETETGTLDVAGRASEIRLAAAKGESINEEIEKFKKSLQEEKSTISTPPDEFEKVTSAIETVTGKEEPAQKPMHKPENITLGSPEPETSEINIPVEVSVEVEQKEPEEELDDWGELEKPEPLPEGYDKLTPKELYLLCRERGLIAGQKKTRSYYINLLEKSVDI